jgi:hypothetical protein
LPEPLSNYGRDGALIQINNVFAAMLLELPAFAGVYGVI